MNVTFESISVLTSCAVFCCGRGILLEQGIRLLEEIRGILEELEWILEVS